MRVYNYKYHVVLSIIISGIIGGISFLKIKPTTFNSATGELISKDSGQIVMQHTTYGYDAVVTVAMISLFIMLVLYKPLKKIMDRQTNNTN